MSDCMCFKQGRRSPLDAAGSDAAAKASAKLLSLAAGTELSVLRALLRADLLLLLLLRLVLGLEPLGVRGASPTPPPSRRGSEREWRSFPPSPRAPPGTEAAFQSTHHLAWQRCVRECALCSVCVFVCGAFACVASTTT